MPVLGLYARFIVGILAPTSFLSYHLSAISSAMSCSAARPWPIVAIWMVGRRVVGTGVDACVVRAKPIRAPEEAALIITIIMLMTRNTHDGQSSVEGWRSLNGPNNGRRKKLLSCSQKFVFSAARGWKKFKYSGDKRDYLICSGTC